jgi:hypothetical protein
MPVPIRRSAVAVALVGALTLTACSRVSGNSSAGSASSVATAESTAPAAGAPSGAAAAPEPGSKAGALDSVVVQPRVVRTAEVVVQVDGELSAAAARVRAIAQSVGGSVANETTTYADTGHAAKAGRPGESVLVLRVPTDTLDRTLSLLTGAGGIGKELSRSSTSQDVTGDLADLQSRVTTQRASVARVRALLARATSVQEVVSIESEVTKRESDLEAAEARQAVLADRADFATLTIDLRMPALVPPPPPPPQKPNPFVDGLASGWHAVTASTAVVLTVLGALLPVAVVIAVLGAPVLWWLRRRRPVGPPVMPPPAAPDSGV